MFIILDIRNFKRIMIICCQGFFQIFNKGEKRMIIATKLLILPFSVNRNCPATSNRFALVPKIMQFENFCKPFYQQLQSM